MSNNIEQVESRTITGKGQDRIGIIIKSYNRGEWESFEPVLGEQWPSSGNDSTETLYYTDSKLNRRNGFDDVTFRYTRIKEGYNRSTLKSVREARPLTERSAYLVAWDHILYTTNTSTERPSFYLTSTSITDGNADNIAYRWGSSTNPPSGGWKPVDNGDELYKNIRTYNVSVRVVHETTYYKTQAEVDDIVVKIDNKLSPPLDTHGLVAPLGPINWLCESADSMQEGGYWKLVSRFKYKDYLDKNDIERGWDTDIYDEV